MKKFLSIGIAAIFSGCACVYLQPDEIQIAPPDLPERFQNAFRRNYPSGKMSTVRQVVFQDKVVGYDVFFRDASGAHKRTFIRSNGEVGEAVDVGSGE